MFGIAAQWSFSGDSGKNASALKIDDKPFATVLTVSSDGSMQALSSRSLAPFVPIQLNQFVISLLDVSNNTDSFNKDDNRATTRFNINTGIKTKNYLTDPRSMIKDELFGDNSDSLNIASSVMFIGIGFDFDSAYVKGNAFVGRPLETLTNRLGSPNAPRDNDQGLDTNAYGFEASAGYQLNNSIALGGGFGRMKDKNKETEQTEEVYAVYAQAILAVAPGVQVKPEVGQVERIKNLNQDTNTEESQQSFYAGAVWEINF